MPRPGLCGKGALGGDVVIRGRRVADETDTVKDGGLGLVEIVGEVEAEGGEGLERVGQEAFAAGFVDGRFHGVDDFDMKALARRGDGGRRGQPGLHR